MEDIMNNLAGDVGLLTEEVFGGWALWPSSWSADRPKLEDDVDCHFKEEWAAVDPVVNETVDVESLQRYADRGEDRRHSQLVAFLRRHVSTGRAISGGLSCVEQSYSEKIVRGEAIGRRYAREISLQNLTREARSAAIRRGYLEVDISNCFPPCVLLLYPDMDIPSVRKYNKYKSLWRNAVSLYYEIPAQSAKEVLMCAMYGYPSPRNEISESRDSLPFAERIACDVERVRTAICNDKKNTYQYFVETARPYPAATTFFYYVSEKEDEILAS